MFIDYYAVLEIKPTATQEEIRAAFKRQARKWHPDKNIGLDTTLQMQVINEAYLILKDSEAKERYDAEYKRFKQYQSEKRHKAEKQREHYKQSKEQYRTGNNSEKKHQYTDFDVHDEILKKWMNTAKKQAVDLAKQTIEDFKGMASAGTKGAAKGCFNQFLAQIIIGIVFTLLLLMYRGCNN